MESNSAVRRDIYKIISAVARPGDVCFFITQDPQEYQRISWTEKSYRRWMGFCKDDISVWHMGILSKFEKKHHSSMVRPYIIHSVVGKGVTEQHISPEYFTSFNDRGTATHCRTIMEVIRYQALTEQQNEQFVEFCRCQIGKHFPKSIRGESLTYILGLPNIFNPPDEFSCHSLVYSAFEQVGVYFPHHIENAPFINVAKYLGHPLRHEKDRMNTHYPYLRDHHMYRDPRMKCILTLTLDQCTGTIQFQENPEKYSWDHRLADAYN